MFIQHQIECHMYIYIVFYSRNIDYVILHNYIKFKVRLVYLHLQSCKNRKSKYSSEHLKIEASCLLPGNRYSLFKAYPIIDTNRKLGWIQICYLLEDCHFVKSRALQFNGKSGYYKITLI